MAIDVGRRLKFREDQIERLQSIFSLVPGSSSLSIVSQINQKLEELDFDKILSVAEIPKVIEMMGKNLLVCQEERDSNMRKLKVAKKKISDLEHRGVFVAAKKEVDDEESVDMIGSGEGGTDEVERLKRRVAELESEKVQSDSLLEKALVEAERIQNALESELSRHDQERQNLMAQSAKYNKQVHEKEKELEVLKMEMRRGGSFRQPVITNLLSGESSPEDMASSAGNSVKSSPSVSSVASLRAVHENAFNELETLAAQRQIDELQVSLRSAERELTLTKSRLSEVAGIETQLARCNRDLVEKETKILSLERQIQVRDTELYALRSRSGDNLQLKEMTDQLRNNMATIHQLQEGLGEMTSRVVQDEQKSKNELNDMMESNKRLESEILELRVEVDEGQKVNDSRLAEILELKNAVDTLLTKLQKKTDLITDLDSQIAKANNEGIDYLTISEQLRRETIRCKQLERSVEEASDTVRRLERQLGETKTISDSRIAELEKSLTRVREDALANSVALSRAETELGIERSKMNSLMTELESTRELVKGQTVFANRADEQVVILRREKLDLETELEAIKLDLRINQSSSDMSGLLANLRADVTERNSRIFSLSNDLENLRIEVRETQKCLEQARDEVGSKQVEIDQLRTTLYAVEKARDTFSVELLKKTDHVNRLQSALSTAKMETELIGSAVAVSGIEELKNRVANLEEDLSIANFEKKSLQDEMGQSNLEIDRLQRLLSDVEKRSLTISEHAESRLDHLRNNLLKKWTGIDAGGELLPRTFEGIVNALDSHVSSLNSRISDQEKKILHLSSELDSVSASSLTTSVNVKSQLTNLVEGMTTLRDESNLKDREISELRSAIEDLKSRHVNELTMVETQLLSVRDLLTQSETDHLMAQEKRLGQLRETHRTQIEAVQKNARENVLRVEQLNSDLQSRIDEMEKQIVTQSLSLDMSKRESLEEVRKSRNDLELARVKIKELEAQLIAETQGIETMKKLTASSYEEQNSLQRTIDDQTAEIKRLKELIGSMKALHQNEIDQLMKELVASAESMETVIREIYDQKISAIETIRGEKGLSSPRPLDSPKSIRPESSGTVFEKLKQLRLEILTARDDFNIVIDREVLIRQLESAFTSELSTVRSEYVTKLADCESQIAELQKALEETKLSLSQREEMVMTMESNVMMMREQIIVAEKDKLEIERLRICESQLLVAQSELKNSLEKVSELETFIETLETVHREELTSLTTELVETAESMERLLDEMNELKKSAIQSVREAENYPIDFPSILPREKNNHHHDDSQTDNISSLRESLRVMKGELLRERDEFEKFLDREVFAARMNQVHQQELILVRREHEEKVNRLNDTISSRDVLVSELKQTIADHNMIISQNTIDVEELKVIVSQMKVKLSEVENSRELILDEKTAKEEQISELLTLVAEKDSTCNGLKNEIECLESRIEEIQKSHESAMNELSVEMVEMAESMESVMREIYEQKISAIDSIRSGGELVVPVVNVVVGKSTSPSRALGNSVSVSPDNIEMLRNNLVNMREEILKQRSDFSSVIENELVVANLEKAHKMETELLSAEYSNKINSLNDLIRERDTQISILRQSMKNKSDDVSLDLSQRDLEIISLNKSLAELKLGHRQEMDVMQTQAEQLRAQIVEIETSALARSEQRISELHDSYKKQMNSLRKVFEDEKAALQSELLRISELEIDLRNRIDEKDRELLERDLQICSLRSMMEEIERTREVEKLLIAANTTAEMNALDNSRNEILSGLENEKIEREILFRKEMDQLCEVHEKERKEFESIRADLESSILARDDCVAELQARVKERDNLVNELKIEVGQLKNDQIANIAMWEEKVEETREMITKQFEKEMERICETHARELGIAQKELEESRKVFEAQLKQFEDRILETEQDTDKILNLHEQEIEALISPRETQRVFLEAEIVRLETTIQDKENMFSSVIAEKDADIEELIRVVDELEHEIQSTRDVHETEIETMENQVRSTVELLNQSVDAVNEQQDIVIESIKETLMRQMDDIRAENADTIDLLELELERRADEIDGLKKRIEESLIVSMQSREAHEIEISALNNLLTEIKANNASQLSELESQISSMREVLSETEIAAASRFEQRIREVQESYGRQIDAMRTTSSEEVSIRDSEIRRLQNELEMKNVYSSELGAKYDDFVKQKQDEFEVLMKKIARKDGEIIAQAEQMDKLYSEISDIRRKNAEYVALLESSIEELNKRMNESLALAEQHEATRISEMETGFNEQILMLKNQVRDSEIEREKFLLELKNRDDMMIQLQRQRDDLESKLKDSVSVMFNKENVATNLEVSNGQLLGQVEKLSTQLMEAKKLARDSIAQYEDQCDELKLVREELGDTEEELSALKTKFDEQFTEYMRVQESGLLASEKISQLESAWKAAKIVAEQAQRNMAETVVELKSAKSEINLLKSRLSALQTQVQDQQLEIELMDAEVSMKASEALKRQTTNSSVEPSPRSVSGAAPPILMSSSRTFGSENFSPSARRPTSRVPALGLPIPARQRSGSMNASLASSAADSGFDTRDADIEALQGYAAARDKKIKALMRSEEMMRSEISALTDQIAANSQIVSEASMLKTRVEFLTRELEKSNRQPETIPGTDSRRLDAYIESTKRLEEQLMLSKVEIEQMKKASQSVQSMRTDIDRLEKSESKLLKKIEKLNTQVAEMDSLRDKILSLEEQISSASIDEEPDVTSENKIRELNKELMSQNAETTRLQTRIVVLEKDFKTMEREKFVITREKLDIEIAFKELSVKYEEQIVRLEDELREVQKQLTMATAATTTAGRGGGSKNDEVEGLHDLVSCLENRILRTPTPPAGTEFFFDPHSPSVHDPEDTERTLDVIDSLVHQLALGRGELEEIRRIASYMDASAAVLSPRSSATTVAKDHARIAMISDTVLRFMNTVNMIEKGVEILKEERQRGFVSMDEAVQLQHRIATLQSALEREGDKRKAIKLTIRELCDKTTDLCNKYSFGS